MQDVRWSVDTKLAKYQRVQRADTRDDKFGIRIDEGTRILAASRAHADNTGFRAKSRTDAEFKLRVVQSSNPITAFRGPPGSRGPRAAQARNHHRGVSLVAIADRI